MSDILIPESSAPTIEELLSRDPLSLTEASLDENVRLLVKMTRAQREVWENEKAKAKSQGKKLAGGAVKKKQRSAERQAAAALLGDLGIT